jgi:hypothetical protein
VDVTAGDISTPKVRVAAILRGVKLPHVRISGFGANLHYPKRIFETAIEKLRSELGKSPIEIYQQTVYRSD